MYHPILVLALVLVPLSLAIYFRRRVELDCARLIGMLHKHSLRNITNLIEDDSILHSRRRVWHVTGGRAGLRRRWENTRILQQVLQLRYSQSDIEAVDIAYVSGLNIANALVSALAVALYPIGFACDRLTLCSVRLFAKMAYRVHTLIQDNTPLCGKHLADSL